MYEHDKMTFISELFDRYYDPLVLYCKRKLRLYPELYDLAEECVQDVFCIALEKYNELLTHPDVKGWLFRTCENKIRNICKKHIGRSRFHAFSTDNETSPELYDPHDSFRLAEEQENYDRLVEKIYSVLLESEKDIFDDYFLRGYNTRKVAKRNNKSLNSVKSCLFRVRKRLNRIK